MPAAPVQITEDSDDATRSQDSEEGQSELKQGSSDTEPAASPLELAFGLQLDPEALSAAYGEAYAGFSRDVTLCMRSAGFEYTERPLVVPPPDDFRLVQSNSQLESIYSFGYTLSENLSRAIDPERAEPLPADEITLQNRETFRGLSPSERDVFRNIRAECFNQAGEQNPLPDDLESAITLEIAEIRAAAGSSPAIIALWSEWSSCMSQQGLTFVNRLEAIESLVPDATALGSRLENEGRTPALIDDINAFADVEAALVAIDIQCSEQIDLVQREQSARHEFESAWLEDNGDRVNLLLQEAQSAD